MKLFAASKQLKIKDETKNIEFNVLLTYPTEQESQKTAFGPYTLDVREGGEIAAGTYPLVLVSHGSGGSHILYHTVATHLSKNGYIVAMVEHYGNNRNDNSLEESQENLILRPKHLSLTIDKLLASDYFGKHIDASRIAIYGHSMGGYAALALSGGTPRNMDGSLIETVKDTRIGALVLAAPASGWFYRGLENVDIPILLLAGEHDLITPKSVTDIIPNFVPDKNKVEYRIIENAGHFSFLCPFPEFMRSPEFFPGNDPEGFDREKFHKVFPDMILEFLEKVSIKFKN
jgi:predicted dienelactone hydrolase